MQILRNYQSAIHVRWQSRQLMLLLWLACCQFASGELPPSALKDSTVAWQQPNRPVQPDRQEPSKQEQRENPEARKDNWIEENLLLFLLLVHGAWIIPLVTYLIVAPRIVRKREQRRTNELKAVAEQLELQFQDTGDAVFEERVGMLPLFNIGRLRTMTNLIIADTGDVRITLFDYKYVTGHGKNRRVRRQTVALAQADDLNVPAFHLRPEGMWDSITSLFGWQDIDFVEHPDFSKAFVLRSDMEEATREFFDKDLLDFFTNHPKTCFESAHDRFVYFHRWKRVDPQQDAMRNFLTEGFQALQALRERVNRQS